ncbi:MAG: hypothetical protein HY360_23180 [Verrucomicrobia bacterium]|nr:hypothetical protein [Verrucomicrobiota bacterium]
MERFIAAYLALSKVTVGFTALDKADLSKLENRLIVVHGLALSLEADKATPKEILRDAARMRAVGFDTEPAITAGVYLDLRAYAMDLVERLNEVTNGFTIFSADVINANPKLLPFLQKLAGFRSKSEMKRAVGNASDHAIPVAAAQKLADLITRANRGRTISRNMMLESVEPTLEGIVRDLVGKVLLESVVADALASEGVTFIREKEYESLRGVVYDFRADFLIPDAASPKAFIEVRKSSTRHASLYAKDKMFSAINWKGRNKDLLAVLIVEGPWTRETLTVMARVFDYVMPLSRSAETAAAIKAYVNGDKSKLKWLIQFSINPAS